MILLGITDYFAGGCENRRSAALILFVKGGTHTGVKNLRIQDKTP